MSLTNQDLQAIKEVVHDPLEKQIEGLAAAVNNSFEEYDAKHEERFDKIDARFTEIDQRFDRIDSRFTEVDERFDNIDGNLNVIKSKLKISSDDYGDHEKRIKFIEKKLEIRN